MLSCRAERTYALDLWTLIWCSLELLPFPLPSTLGQSHGDGSHHAGGPSTFLEDVEGTRKGSIGGLTRLLITAQKLLGSLPVPHMSQNWGFQSQQELLVGPTWKLLKTTRLVVAIQLAFLDTWASGWCHLYKLLWNRMSNDLGSKEMRMGLCGGTLYFGGTSRQSLELRC